MASSAGASRVGATVAPGGKGGSPSKATVAPLSRKGVIYLSLLALQFGAQPLLFREFSSRSLNKKSIVLVGEMTKFMLCTLMLIVTGQLGEAVKGWSAMDALKLAGAPALVYTVQNVCIQTAYVNMDGLSFNLLNQSKILFTAVALYFMMGRRQSMVQVVALIGLFGASCILAAGKAQSSGAGAADADKGVAFYEGVLPCLAASMLSGVASGLSQIALQSKNRHSLIFTMELATFSVISVLIGEYVLGDLSIASMSRGWTIGAMIPVLSNGLGGICVGMVVKYAGGVRKGFAIVGGIILTGFLQYFLYKEPLSMDLLIALPLVLVSVSLHILYPYVPPSDDKKKAE